MESESWKVRSKLATNHCYFAVFGLLVAVVYKKGMNYEHEHILYSYCFLYVFFRGNYYSQRYWEISAFTIPKNDFLFNFLFSFLDIVTKLLLSL